MHLLERSKIAIIIPAFNESRTIGKVVSKLKKIGNVIVIDDASTDQTSTIARKNGAKIITNKFNIGYDSSINKGFNQIKNKNYKVFLTCDGDDQFEYTSIKKLLKSYNSNNSMIIGSRNKILRFSEKLFSVYTKIRFGVEDPLCGVKCYNIMVCKKYTKFDRYNSIGTDLMLRILFKNRNIQNFKLKIKKRKGSSRFGNFITSNLKIFRSLILGLFFYGK